MSGCGDTWFNKRDGAIGFEPMTDKDLDRLEELLEDLKKAGYEKRISKGTSMGCIVALEDIENK